MNNRSQFFFIALKIQAWISFECSVAVYEFNHKESEENEENKYKIQTICRTDGAVLVQIYVIHVSCSFYVKDSSLNIDPEFLHQFYKYENQILLFYRYNS